MSVAEVNLGSEVAKARRKLNLAAGNRGRCFQLELRHAFQHALYLVASDSLFWLIVLTYFKVSYNWYLSVSYSMVDYLVASCNPPLRTSPAGIFFDVITAATSPTTTT